MFTLFPVLPSPLYLPLYSQTLPASYPLVLIIYPVNFCCPHTHWYVRSSTGTWFITNIHLRKTILLAQKSWAVRIFSVRVGSNETLPHDWKLTVLILCLSYEVNRRCWEFMYAVVGHSWKVLFLWNPLWHLPLTIFPFPFPWHHLNPAVKGMIQMSNLRLGLTESLILCIGLSVTTTLTAQKKLLWWVLSVGIIYDCRHKNLESSLTLCPFSKIIAFISSMTL